MTQQDFEILLLLLKNANGETEIYSECFNSLKEDRVLLHRLGVFETQNVVSIFKDKIALQKLNVQQHDYIGMEVFFKRLVKYQEPRLQQYIISASMHGYLLILSTDGNSLVGVLKKSRMNFEDDIRQQQQLKQAGHQNHELFLFKNGLFVKSIDT